MSLDSPSSPLRIIYAGTPEFAVPALGELLGTGHSIIAVYTQPDRPAGRGRKIQPSPVKALAVQAGLPVYQPANFRDQQDLLALEALDADLMIVAAYGLLLPQRVLEAPRLGCINIHASLLPRWRGAAPIQRAILAGDDATGITIMQMEAGLDTGPMLLRRSIPIDPTDTAADLHDRLSELGAEALIEAIELLTSDQLNAEPQQDALACYASKLSKDEARIDWNQGALEISRQVRAFNPWPVAQCMLGEQLLRIWRAEALEQDSPSPAQPGRVTSCGKSGIDVETAQGILRILELQLPGKRPVDAASFANAHPIAGTTLG